MGADGLICAYLLDGQGGGTSLDWQDLGNPIPRDAIVWIHLNRSCPKAQNWLLEESGLDPLMQEALSANESRPRCVEFSGGLLLNMRGVNLSPGANPEDMVSIRLWAEKNRVISVRRRPLMAVNDLKEKIENGRGPRSVAELIADLADGLVERMASVLSELSDGADELEDQIVTAQNRELRSRLMDIRRQTIALRRYLAPQRDTMAHLSTFQNTVLDERSRGRLRETADSLTRYVEDLESIRERGAVLADELASRLTDQMNRVIYVLSVVAGIFLPLSLLTGLLGINVGGIPGTDNPWSFAIVSAGVVVLGVFEFFLLRKLHWI